MIDAGNLNLTFLPTPQLGLKIRPGRYVGPDGVIIVRLEDGIGAWEINRKYLLQGTATAYTGGINVEVNVRIKDGH